LIDLGTAQGTNSINVACQDPSGPTDRGSPAARLGEPTPPLRRRRHPSTAAHGYLARRAGAGRAEDLAANTFVIAFERRGTFRAEADSARPWLLGIATNLRRSDQGRDLDDAAATRFRPEPGYVTTKYGMEVTQLRLSAGARARHLREIVDRQLRGRYFVAHAARAILRR
jgi:hypothetical protein